MVMTQERYYPSVDEKSIKLLLRLMESDPKLLDHPECPYSDDFKSLFKHTEKARDFDTSDDTVIPDANDLLTQINMLSRELAEYGQTIKHSDNNASDRNTYFRLSVTLMEKLVDIKERISKISQYEAFIGTILEFMDREFTPDQRNLLVQGLSRYLPEEKTQES